MKGKRITLCAMLGGIALVALAVRLVTSIGIANAGTEEIPLRIEECPEVVKSALVGSNALKKGLGAYKVIQGETALLHYVIFGIGRDDKYVMIYISPKGVVAGVESDNFTQDRVKARIETLRLQ